MIILIIIFIIIIILLALFLLKQKFGNVFANTTSWYRKKTILTYTTFLDFKKSNKYEFLTRSIDSILENHSDIELSLIDKFVIINEYSEDPTDDWTDVIKEKYPFVEFIQKNENQRGQVYSINMILEMIKGYDYWIHIEESWYCIRPFIEDCINIMSNTNITQLQINLDRVKDVPSWLDLPQERYSCTNIKKSGSEMTEYCIIRPPHDLITEKEWGIKKGWRYSWPLYSLQPSINRVKKYAEIGLMPDDPSLWPVTFEFLYGLRFLEKGSVKGVLKKSAFKRDNHKHISTYN